MDEIAAGIAEKLLLDKQTIQDFVQADRSTAKTFFEHIKEAFAKLKAKLTGKELSQVAKTEQRALKLWEDAFTAAEKQAERNAKNANTTQNAQKNTATEGGGVQFLIKYTTENRPFVEVDTDILAGIPKKEWESTVKKVLAEKFPSGVHVGAELIKINSQSRREMTYSKYAQWLSSNGKNLYLDRYKAIGQADEIILASRGYINEGLKHARKDKIRDFARGSVLLRVGDTDYVADVVVGRTNGNSLLLYDVINLKKTAFEEKSRGTKQPGQMSSYRSGAPASEVSITQDAAGVNRQFMSKASQSSESVESQEQQADEEYLEAVENDDLEKAQLLVDQSAENAMSESKIRGKDGKLLPVYHGTKNAFYTLLSTFFRLVHIIFSSATFELSISHT